VTWDASRRMLDELRRATRPDAIVMFGLAGSASSLRVEAIARNVANRLRRDATGGTAPSRVLRTGGPATLRARADLQRIVAAIRATGVRACLSRDAGDYLCNATLWTAIETTRPSIPVLFVHVPRLRNTRRAADALLRAGLAAILATRLARPAYPSSPPMQTYLASR
jgi:pyroglutamyl-peptidase